MAARREPAPGARRAVSGAARSLCRDCGRRGPLSAETCPACGSRRLARHRELDALALAHLDCDAFYAAIEKRDRPELADVPVIVGGRHRGVVAACCYVARGFGVRSAMPMFQALRACPQAVVIAPDMRKYAHAGRALRALMRETTPLVEPLSIDEAFLDLAGTESAHRASPAETVAALARRVEAKLGISVSIGLSYNKFLAKIASDLDKPRGFATIGRSEARGFLAERPVELLWGVGAATRRRLAQDGIARIGDLVQVGEAELVARYGSVGRRLFRCALGEDERPVEPRRAPKSVSSEITLARDLAELDGLRPVLWRLAEKVSARLKRSGLAGAGVALKLKTADFQLITRARRAGTATQSAEEIYRVAEALLVREADGRAFRLIGVGAHALGAAERAAQGELFAHAADPRLERTLDAARARFGAGVVGLGRGFGGRSGRPGSPGPA